MVEVALCSGQREKGSGCLEGLPSGESASLVDLGGSSHLWLTWSIIMIQQGRTKA
jgi:hypothetical protein